MAFPGRPAHDFSSLYSRAEADGILVRSASMHDMDFPECLLAVGRAGAWWMRGSVLSGRGGL